MGRVDVGLIAAGGYFALGVTCLIASVVFSGNKSEGISRELNALGFVAVTYQGREVWVPADRVAQLMADGGWEVKP